MRRWWLHPSASYALTSFDEDFLNYEDMRRIGACCTPFQRACDGNIYSGVQYHLSESHKPWGPPIYAIDVIVCLTAICTSPFEKLVLRNSVVVICLENQDF